jgi:Mn-containing catalase
MSIPVPNLQPTSGRTSPPKLAPRSSTNRLINLCDDPGVKDALAFLMTREIAHQESFEKALYAIEANLPPGKPPGQPEFTNTYFNMSQGDGDLRGPWNQGEQCEFVEDRAKQAAVDGGDGLASVKLSRSDATIAKKVAARTMSDPSSDPVTGAALGQEGAVAEER